MSHNSARKQRVEWVDYAKGIAIFFVVAVHVFGGVIGADLIENTTVIDLYASWVYFSFNMPVFFFLAGLFISRSVRKSLPVFTSARLRTMIYPYVLWSLISLFIGTLMVSFTNSGFAITPENLFRILYDPILHYWFLYAMFVLVMIFIFLAKAGLPVSVFIAFCFVLLIFGRAVDLLSFSYWMGRLADFSAYLALGIIFSERIRDFIENTRISTLGLLSAGGLMIWLGFVVIVGKGDVAGWQIDRYIAMTAGTAGVLMLCGLLDRLNLFGKIRDWGLLSLEIYLAHVIAGSGFRIIFDRFLGIENGAFHVVFGTLAAFFLPVLLVYVVNRVNFNYLFTLPERRKPRTEPVLATGGTD